MVVQVYWDNPQYSFQPDSRKQKKEAFVGSVVCPESAKVLEGRDVEFLLFSLQLTPRHLVRRARLRRLSASAVINAVRWVRLAPSGRQVPRQGPCRQLAV
jgi:hypothetical protein